MNGETKPIVWLPSAKEDLKKLIQYIKKDSLQNALKVKTEILLKISDLSIYPERYSPDKFKLLNAESKYRAFSCIKSELLITLALIK